MSTKHGHSAGRNISPECRIWINMRQRCNNPKDTRYEYYGGRGIKVCPRWEEAFTNFLADMGSRPPGKSLDRINNDGPYSPENCRWATQKEQVKNRRTTVWINLNGVELTLAEAAEAHNIPWRILWQRIKWHKMSPERAIQPYKPRKRKVVAE